MKAFSGTTWLLFCMIQSVVLCPALFAADPIDKKLVDKRKSAPQWIWSAAHTKNKVPEGVCHFRKTLKIKAPEEGEIRITADNQFQLYVNGQPVGTGSDWREIEVFDITKHLQKGINTIAVEATNTDAGSAGMVARVLIKEVGGTFQSYSTDTSWKTSVRRYRNWTTPGFPESEWVAAVSFGSLGAALPWGNEMVVAGEGTRFEIPEGFNVQRLMQDEEVGSLIAMAFDSAGNILASREGGHLQLISDSNKDGSFDTVQVYCDQIKNTQGILSLGSRVFAVGHGPDGVALYQLRDADRDGVAEEIQSIVPIRGSRGEHGAHAVRLGPDGLLYVLLGNYARVGMQPGPRSPYRNWYEGHLIDPKEEDPRGHAVGVPAPGGTIFRTDTKGSFVELVAGGFRNPYDFAFNAEGEMFTYDADMEWDVGAPWYRPTRINHVTAGAEFGWRSGWAKWPEYYQDNLPSTFNVGKGSPTGIEFYGHTAFPESYRGALFGCDWATGKIHCFRLEPKGASYKIEQEVFVAGRPLNATDISVGPDGSLYFCTGGRGTDGGIYRVVYEAADASESVEEPNAIDRILTQPQMDADWSRSIMARTRGAVGAGWGEQLVNAALDIDRKVVERMRAVELLVLFGPRPDDELLLSLATDENLQIRAQATRLMYTSTSLKCRDQLIRSLEDEDALVRRLACEALTRSGLPTAAEKHVRMLADKDRHVAFAARRSLEQLPVDLWEDLVLALGKGDIVGFCRGANTLLATRRDQETAKTVLQKCLEHLTDKESPYTEEQLTSLLRTSELAFILGDLDEESAPDLGEMLLARYPSNNRPVDRELVKLLVFLDVEGAAQKFAAQIEADIPPADRLHIAAYGAKLQSGWDTDSKLALMQYYESVRNMSAGYSVSAYVENFARDFFSKLSLEERGHILSAGERWPTSALSVLARLPEEVDTEMLAKLRSLDSRVQPLCTKHDSFRRLRVGVLAVLGRSGEADSLAYLRETFRNEPEQRDTIAMSLTQHPGDDSWPYLIESLKTVRGAVAREVLAALAKVAQRPSEPEPYRQVILLGLQMDAQDASLATNLLNHWSGQVTTVEEVPHAEQLKTWQEWYTRTFPKAPPAELPTDSGKDKWSYEELLTYLESDAALAASAERGKQAFTTAQCIKCHRCGAAGESIGPDLTTVAQRFQKKEILESIVYPSHIISDQYASKQVLANGRTYVGLAVPTESGTTVLLPDGEKVELPKDEIESISPSRISAMPEGLLNSLSLQQVADLFAFLSERRGQEIATEATSSIR